MTRTLVARLKLNLVGLFFPTLLLLGGCGEDASQDPAGAGAATGGAAPTSRGTAPATGGYALAGTGGRGGVVSVSGGNAGGGTNGRTTTEGGTVGGPSDWASSGTGEAGETSQGTGAASGGPVHAGGAGSGGTVLPSPTDGGNGSGGTNVEGGAVGGFDGLVSGGAALGGTTGGVLTGIGGTGSGAAAAAGGQGSGGLGASGAAVGGAVIGGRGLGGFEPGGAGGAPSSGTPGGGQSALGGASDAGGAGTGGSGESCSPPSVYRNLFVELLGKTAAEVDAKLEAIADQLFRGDANQTIYYELGDDQGYILDVANNDVRSEGQSYGMTFAVQMDMKTEFDKLWNYAAQCMRQQDGMFAWQMNPGSCTARSTSHAPDGEEYFAMALMLASRRWGDSGAVDYGSEARKVLSAMLAPRPAGEFVRDPALVTFGPYQEYSDPSYVLPLFYSEWACFDTSNSAFWTQAVTDGRAHLRAAAHPRTGLIPGLTNLDGTPYGTQYDYFNWDAQRVPMNVMMDFNLTGGDEWQATWAGTLSAFWVSEGLDSYGSTYELDGTGKSGMHNSAMTAMNAMLAFALSDEEGLPFVERAWNAGIPSGSQRYYDGSLYMLAMLHLSGKFRLSF